MGEKCTIQGLQKLYNPITKKIIISRDFKFLEDQTWNDQDKWTTMYQIYPLAFEQGNATEVEKLRQGFTCLQVPVGDTNQGRHNVDNRSSRREYESTILQKTRSFREIYE